ncbi:hypothetical protein EAL2_c16220 [Peptoclostridium acidaminophilum DSM 3953]|uniref:Uncharacterized protein n=2 Tax=Peptoclostridium acidaminophilum TaxID=1731 RepID=W8TL33_PEPAC|nr:hypothetical protein EAL2_c16220 [Peptoclostridium acidaminophilum DSM 3953]
MNVNVSQSAREQLESYYSENNKSKDKDFVRVYISRFG